MTFVIDPTACLWTYQDTGRTGIYLIIWSGRNGENRCYGTQMKHREPENCVYNYQFNDIPNPTSLNAESTWSAKCTTQNQEDNEDNECEHDFLMPYIQKRVSWKSFGLLIGVFLQRCAMIQHFSWLQNFLSAFQLLDSAFEKALFPSLMWGWIASIIGDSEVIWRQQGQLGGEVIAGDVGKQMGPTSGAAWYEK